MALLIVRMVLITATSKNAGSSAQNIGPKSRLKPGHSFLGRPTHEAEATRSVSYRPKKPPIIEPATTPMTGAHSRNAPVAFSAMPLMMIIVASALSGADRTGVPGGVADSRFKMAGITVIGISMMTVPATVGVKSRWNSESR